MDEFNWKDFFAFTKKERSGILTLVILILLTIAARIFLSSWTTHENQISQEAFQSMDSLQQNITTMRQEKEEKYTYDEPDKYNKKTEKKEEVLKPFEFNPNKLDRPGWKKMGFSSDEVDMIMKFRDAGGNFEKKEDIKNLYCVDDQEYRKLKDYIRIDSSKMKKEKTTSEKDEKQSFDQVIDLNKADTIDLVEVPGVGPYYAKQILKYRSALGGYVNKKQLKEVYGLENKYENLLAYFKVDTLITDSVKVNTSEYYDILGHPYIDKTLAYKITKYRRMKGNFQSPEDLRKINAVSDSLIRKLEPYIKIN